MKIPFQIKHQQFERIINLDTNAVAVAQMCYEKLKIRKFPGGEASKTYYFYKKRYCHKRLL